MKFPKTFTIGEAMIVCQSIVLYVVMTMVQMYNEAGDEDHELITNIVNVSWFLFIISPIHFVLMWQGSNANYKEKLQDVMQLLVLEFRTL